MKKKGKVNWKEGYVRVMKVIFGEWKRIVEKRVYWNKYMLVCYLTFPCGIKLWSRKARVGAVGRRSRARDVGTQGERTFLDFERYKECNAP
jgi:hypothetical protein